MKEDDFIFSLFPNDLIRVSHKRGLTLTKVFTASTLPSTVEVKSEFLYYKGAGIAGAVISCINHNNTYEVKSLGIKTLEKLEKCTVDVLGEVHTVKEKKRQSFSGKGA